MSEALHVDGDRAAVDWVATLPAAWTKVDQRLVLMLLAADSYGGQHSSPGVANLAAWSGLSEASVRRALTALLHEVPGVRPALLRVDSTRGRNRATYHFLRDVEDAPETPAATHRNRVANPPQPTGTLSDAGGLAGSNPVSTVSDAGGLPSSLEDLPSSLAVRLRAHLGDPTGWADEDGRTLSAPDQTALAENLTAVAARLVEHLSERTLIRDPVKYLLAIHQRGQLLPALVHELHIWQAVQERVAAQDRRRCVHGVVVNADGDCVQCDAEREALEEARA